MEAGLQSRSRARDPTETVPVKLGPAQPDGSLVGVRFQRETYDPPDPPERDALRLRAAKADEVFSGRIVGELILDVRETHADASAGLLDAALDAILAQCIAEPFEPWPGLLRGRARRALRTSAGSRAAVARAGL